MGLLRSATAHDTTTCYALAALATYPIQIDIVPQLVEIYKELEPITLTGSRNVFDMAQKRGGYLISVLAAELIYLDAGELCANGTAAKLLDVTSDVLTGDTFLNALCKRANLWHGPTVGTAAADLLRAIVGCLDTLGTQKARNFVFALLQPFVSPAVLGFLQSLEDHGNTARPLQSSFTFSVQRERIPEEMSATKTYGVFSLGNQSTCHR
ncbi:uncharacterized protein SCHCODRAFT_02516673 [Schizophyllum commune H4-8]|uniref:Expressed protein n=1 Tax=Schizophyllum commune (strain H4-8 / FGSC 9210) TaxID=578458 RepID=D8QHC2_SCHCM|nr:uncharacterized protein SCHCODRAFT_02516673 [Schizophyllum commune H4-8]KAI5887122.1 hypothetical protein SCHCODRAFT_02516673 [Schizophyllum commune H4-8]